MLQDNCMIRGFRDTVEGYWDSIQSESEAYCGSYLGLDVQGPKGDMAESVKEPARNTQKAHYHKLLEKVQQLGTRD